jgi:regulator of replication initiation timing
MPFSIEITMSIWWIPLACLVGALVGFIFRSTQLNKLRYQIQSLENQVRESDAEILTLQKENGILQDQISKNVVPGCTNDNKRKYRSNAGCHFEKKVVGKIYGNTTFLAIQFLVD